MSKSYQLDDLLLLMSRLRDPETGCPWDIKQDFRSITSSTIEEVYEVVDAIEREDYLHLKEELGDLLFQIVFYSQMGQEKDVFDFPDVVQGVTEKLIRRHPHVFPEGTLNSVRTTREPDEQAIKLSWEKIKAEERAEKGAGHILDDVPLALPAITRAYKLQKRAASVGFDWASITDVIDKLDEEVEEFKRAVVQEDSEALADELGDLMFTCVNLARHLSLEPERVLRLANQKFTTRFNHVDEQVSRLDQNWSDLTLAQLERYWVDAKNTTS